MAEHGLALWMYYGGEQILFDTGQGLVLNHNIASLKLNPSQLKGLVLSHGHYDHGGGLRDLPAMPVYCHPQVFSSKAIRVEGQYRDVSIPWTQEFLEAEGYTFLCNREPREILPGMYLSGEIPRVTDYEDTGGPLYSFEAGTYRKDPLLDDQALIIKGRDGVVVLLGCAHAGLINTLHHASAISDTSSIHTVMGGMHLCNASEGRMEKTVEDLQAFQVQKLIPMHCTGFSAMQTLYRHFPHSFVKTGVGDSITLQ